MRARSAFVLLASLSTGSAWSSSKVGRRLFFESVAAVVASPAAALAFENKVSSKYDDRPKRRGPQPKDLAVGSRMTFEGDEYQGLKICGAAPNCFCSTMKDDPDHVIPAFVYPSQLDATQAMSDLEQTLKAYPPGQNGVDGGGFQIVTVKPDYIYVQYEALKNGYIDDVEFSIIPGYGDREIQVRSSSRIGYLDFGVNAKRLNWIAKSLREKGWNAVGVDFSVHSGYALENQI